jgi:hypothetical protein
LNVRGVVELYVHFINFVSVRGCSRVSVYHHRVNSA